MFGGMKQVPLEDDYKELRRQIWLATDAVYKKALEDISRKRAALQTRTRSEELPDFSKREAATTTDLLPAAEVNKTEAEKLVRELSALFREMPDVFSSTLDLHVGNLHTRYVDSEGTSFARTTPAVLLTARAETQAPEGMPLFDFVSYAGQSMADLPGKNELVAGIRQMGANLARLRQAPLLEQYNGPVLFEGQAAAELFGQVFAPKLLATRRLFSDNPQFEMFSAQTANPLQDKLGSRVLPASFTVVDNPTATDAGGSRLIGGQKVDDDGVPTREIRLVENGVLKTLLATRVPVRGIPQSTGSRRGGGPAPSNLIVSASNGLADRELKDELLKIVQQRGAEFGLIVRRIANPTLNLLRDPASLVAMLTPRGRQSETVQGLILAYKVYPDGREELIRNVEIADFGVASFKEIVAASKTSTVSSGPFFVRPSSPFAFDPGSAATGGALVSFVIPSLLFEDLTVKKPASEIPKPPVAKHPFFDK